MVFLKEFFVSKQDAVSKGLDLDWDRHFVGSDLGPKILQRLSADDKSTPLASKVK